MDFSEVLQGRRSCRSFSGEPVERDLVSSLLNKACWAPSPLNMQGWRFLVIEDAENKKKVRLVGEEAQKAVMAQDGPNWAGKYGFSFLEEAPLLVAVAYNPTKNGLGFFFNQPHGALMAASALIQNFMLAAWEKGLASLWFTFFDPGEMKKALDLPEKWELAGVIPLGRPEGELKAPPRKEAWISWGK